jgi:hypothetical protein
MAKLHIPYFKFQDLSFKTKVLPTFVIFIIGILLPILSFAKDINFDVTVDRSKVSLGSSITLNLNFHGTQDIPAPKLPSIDGFDVRYVGPSTQMSIVNGKISTSITHIYSLLPLKVGTFTIPSFSVEYDGKIYTSNPIQIEIVQSSVSQPQGIPQTGQPEAVTQGLEDRIFLVMSVDKTKAYVNEIIPVTFKLYINKLAIRDIQYPEFLHEGFSVGEFSEAKKYQEILNDVLYDVIEFNANIFGMRAGQLKLGPAELRCNLIVKKQPRRRRSFFFDDDFFDSDIFDDFFTRYENYPLVLKSIDIPILVMELPDENRPNSFTGALGNYQFFLEANPKEVKVGDPITLKMVVRGKGNFKTVNPPTLNLEDNFKVYEPEVTQDKTSKIFEQVIIPKDSSITEIPKISFSFFDTRSGQYRTITKGPIPIKVNPLPEEEKLKVVELPTTEMIRKREVLGRDIIYIKDSLDPLRRKGEFLYRNKLFVASQLIPIIAVISIFFIYRRKERLLTDVRYARRLRAPRKAKKNLSQVYRLLDPKKGDKFFDAVFMTLREYLGDKFHLPSAGITANVVEEELRPRNINQEVLNKIRECFNTCDTARYAPSSVTKEEMVKTFKLLEEIIDELERMKA